MGVGERIAMVAVSVGLAAIMVLWIGGAVLPDMDANQERKFLFIAVLVVAGIAAWVGTRPCHPLG